MSSIVLDLAKTFPAIRRPGNFYAAGTAQMFAPILEVDGVGRISLPLLPVQAEQLVAVATRAPYGHGEETVVDIHVRRTWQIDADRIRLGGRHWLQTLDASVAKAAAGLGVTGPVSAEFYKLLIYDTGSFFVEHRDTEKAAGMFAMVRAAMLLPQHRATDLIEKIVVRNAHHVPGACANLLARCCAEMPDTLARHYPAATALVETLLGDALACSMCAPSADTVCTASGVASRLYTCQCNRLSMCVMCGIKPFSGGARSPCMGVQSGRAATAPC